MHSNTRPTGKKGGHGGYSPGRYRSFDNAFRRSAVRHVSIAMGIAMIVAVAACTPDPSEDADASGFSAPTEITRTVNERVRKNLPLDDRGDFEDARRGLMASPPHLQVKSAEGTPVWDMDAFGFIDGPAPASVNPSLWRQAQLNNIHGLFKVTAGIYQLRGFDLANMTLIDRRIRLDRRRSAHHPGNRLRRPGLCPAAPPRPPRRGHHLYPQPYRSFRRRLGCHFGRRGRRSARFRSSHPQASWPRPPAKILSPASPWEDGRPTMFGRHLPASARAYVDTGLGKAVSFGQFGILAPTAR